MNMWLNSESAQKAEILITECLEVSTDAHNIFTPFALCKDVVNKIPSLDGKVLVVANIEFIYTLLQEGVDRTDIYFATPCNEKAAIASLLIKDDNIFVCEGVLDNEGLQNMKFDVIIGNPPYQVPVEEGQIQPKSHSLWPRFVTEGLALLHTNGVLSLVTPSSWMSPNNKIFKIFKDFDLLWVTTDVSHHFDVGTTASAWAIKNSSSNNITTINNNTIVDMHNCPYLVDGESISIHQKVVFNSLDKMQMLQDTTTAHSSYTKKKPHLLSKIETNTHVFPMWHTNRQVLYSTNKSKNQDSQKVMFTTSGYFKPFYDDGQYGVTECSFYMLVNSIQEGEALLSVLTSKLIRFIVSDAKWCGYLNWNVLKSLPLIDITHKWTDEELYQHFNLTNEEIQLIEETIK